MGPKGIEKAVTWVAGSAIRFHQVRGRRELSQEGGTIYRDYIRRSGMRERAVKDTGTTIELIHVGTPQETTPPCLFFHW